ncbi:MAG: hypothetical protein RL291_1982 [Pseudomonadota bacterium]|jgi:serine/threonine protein kinase
MSNLVALPEGTVLVGDFRIKRVLGAGGFGITYLAEEPSLGRLVTIKEYFPVDFAARVPGKLDAVARAKDCEEDYKWGLDRFIDEAQTLAKFNHPNIVRVYRYFRANSTGYMVLHFEEGLSFKLWLKSLQRMPRQAELDPVISPLLDALDVIHKGDFLHRDIAPDNIIIRNDKTPVLIDFGSARGAIAAHSRTVSALVKPGYSPYEQYATTTKEQGPWTDIYALGATLYQAVSGKRPPDAPSRMVKDEIIPVEEAALGSYRRGFLAAIGQALRLDIKERPQSIAAWRGPLLAPDEKPQKKGIGASLGIGLGRGAPGQPAVDPAPVVTPRDAVVPPPPDAPQPQGQLLDFIEKLKKPAAQAPKPAQPVAASAPVAQPMAPKDAGGYGLGYGPAPVTRAAPAPAPQPPMPDRPPPQVQAPAQPAKAPPQPASAPVPSRRALSEPQADKQQVRRRPKRVRTNPLKGFNWFGIAWKFGVGVAVASIAVLYRDPSPPQPPQQTVRRGESIPASQPAEIAQALRLNGHKGPIVGAQFIDGGRRVVSAGQDGSLRVWDAQTGALVRTIELDEGAPLAFHVREREAVTAHKDGALIIWDLERGDKRGRFKRPDLVAGGIAFMADGERFAVGGADGRLTLWDRRSSTETPAGGDAHDLGITRTVFVPGRNAVATGADDRTVKLWGNESFRLIRTYRGHGGPITALDVSPNGQQIYSASVDGTVRMWRASQPGVQRRIRASEVRVTALAVSPIENTIAAADETGQIKIWDTRRGRSLATFAGHSGVVRSLAFSADGRRLVSAGDDGALKVWNVNAFRAEGG